MEDAYSSKRFQRPELDNTYDPTIEYQCIFCLQLFLKRDNDIKYYCLFEIKRICRGCFVKAHGGID